MVPSLLFAAPAILVAATDIAPLPEREYLALLAGLSAAPPEARWKTAQQLAALPAAGLPRYRQRLLQPRAIPAATFRTLLLEIGAQVPNPSAKGGLWITRPPPPWRRPPPVKWKRGETPPPRPRRPPPIDPEKVDWLAALAKLDLAANPVTAALPDRDAARAEAIEAVALLRALAASGSSEAVEPAFDFAFRLEGVFRDECGRALRALGDAALPGLIRRQHQAVEKNADKARLRELPRQQRYASYQLDRMDRARPGRTLAAVSDDLLRADLLRAYGEARALDAVEAILAHTDAASRAVRRAARWAWQGYVSGPAPPSAPKRKRKLPGGAEEKEEKEDYLNYREMALIALGQEVERILEADPAARGGPLGTAATRRDEGEALTRALFEYYDARRSADWEALYRAARSQREAGDLAGAVADFSAVLAHDPLDSRRAEMAPTFAGYARSLADPKRRAFYLRQAMALAADATAARKLAAEIAWLDGARGDEAQLRRLLDLDPDHSEARAALAGYTSARARRSAAWELGALIALAGAALLPLGLVLRRRRAPRGA